MKLHWKEVQRLAEAHTLEDSSASLEALQRFLEFWWCQKYNRPLKDPLLKDYTLDELSYEFLRHFYSNPENDPVKLKEEQAKQTDDEAWIKSQMAEIQSQSAKVSKTVEAIQELADRLPKPPENPEDPTPPGAPDLPDLSTKFD